MKTVSIGNSLLRRVQKPVAWALAAMLLLSGCVSNKYRMVRKRHAVPPVPINRAFTPSPMTAAFSALITYHGPGAWKRDALWDEYVITVGNPGSEPFTITAATLVGHDGKV